MFPLYNPPPPARLDVVITEGAIREREGEVSGVEIVSVEIVRVCVYDGQPRLRGRRCYWVLHARCGESTRENPRTDASLHVCFLTITSP